MAGILRKFSKWIAAGLAYAAQATAEHELMPWGDGPRPLWTRRSDKS